MKKQIIDLRLSKEQIQEKKQAINKQNTTLQQEKASILAQLEKSKQAQEHENQVRICQAEQLQKEIEEKKSLQITVA